MGDLFFLLHVIVPSLACWMSKYSIFFPFACVLAFVYVSQPRPGWYRFSHASKTFNSQGYLCFYQQLRFVSCHHVRSPVFTWLQVCVVTFDSEYGMIHSRWLPPSKYFLQYDSWRKLKLRMVDELEKGGKPGMWLPSNHVLSGGSIHPHPSCGMWHRYKMSPRLIFRAVHTLYRFILKLPVKQNQLVFLHAEKSDWRPLKYIPQAVCTSVDLLMPPFLPFCPSCVGSFLTVKFTSSSDVLYKFFIGSLNRNLDGLLSLC